MASAASPPTRTGHPAAGAKERLGAVLGAGLGHSAIYLGLLAAASACSSEPTASPSPVVSRPAAQTPRSREPLRARIPIPQGSFSSGTEPGRFERQAALEPRPTRTALGPFEIDVEPYPGSGAAPLLALSRAQAAERCAERRGRLCTELEWERACKGPASSPYPSGRELDAACTSLPGCASGFGVWGMGAVPEWTASDLPGRDSRQAIVRGASSDAPAARHRCARRDPRSSEAAPGIGFRCCYGPPNAARVVVPASGRAFGEAVLPLAELAGLLELDPLTQRLARDLSYFDSAAASRAVLGSNGERPGLRLTTAPLAWNPAAGVELLVVTGRSGPSTAFVAVFDALGDGRRLLASSFVMEGEPGPVALLYEPAVRSKLRFSTCAACLGETGRILYEDPDRPLIVQP
jgi:hypothetical protein